MFNEFPTHSLPINRMAAKVAFYSGEHFDPTFSENHHPITMETPPKRRPLPTEANDYTGLRHGRMTAFQYFRPSRKNRAVRAVWVARCDCGRYEFRRPGRWIKHPSPEFDPDRCEYCRRTDTIVRNGGKSADQTRPQRLMAWVRSMRCLGFSDEEITQIRNSDIQTAGCTSDQIRAQLLEKRSVA